MSRKITLSIVLIVSILLLSTMATVPAMAQDDDEDEQGNIICQMNDGNYETTALGGIMGTVTTLIVTVAALIAIVVGAGYTLASAAKPSKEEYVDRRNKSIMYGGGALVVLYGANAIISEFGEDRAMDFSCILPFA